MAIELAAVVLAGGKSDRLATHARVATKASVRFGDRPLVAYVLSALAGCSRVDQIVCVGSVADSIRPTSEANSRPEVVCIPGGDRLVDSLALGLGAALCFAPEGILIVSADLPWLTSASVDAFIAEAPPADLVYPVVGRETMERTFPSQRRTYAHMREGALTGGNVVLVRPGVVAALLPLMEAAYRARKSPLSLASLVGWDLAIRLGLRNLTVSAAEERVSTLLGASARVLISKDAAIAADIDRPEHLSFAPPTEGTVAGDIR